MDVPRSATLPCRTRPAALTWLLLAALSALALLLPASSWGVAQGNPQGEPGFQPITICHATGSESNPFVTITVDTSGELNGHQQHAGDIIPAPAGGCAPPPPPPPPPPPVDACPDLEGVQESAAACPPPVDACPDLAGVQATTAECPPPPAVDACPDLEGIQADASACPPPAEGAAPTPEATPTTGGEEEPAAETGGEVDEPLEEPLADESDEPDEPGAVAGVQDVPTGTVATPTGALPFTGLASTWLLAIGGALLLLAGGSLHAIGSRVRN